MTYQLFIIVALCHVSISSIFSLMLFTGNTNTYRNIGILAKNANNVMLYVVMMKMTLGLVVTINWIALPQSSNKQIGNTIVVTIT